jgi:hypothetical protein
VVEISTPPLLNDLPDGNKRVSAGGIYYLRPEVVLVQNSGLGFLTYAILGRLVYLKV